MLHVSLGHSDFIESSRCTPWSSTDVLHHGTPLFPWVIHASYSLPLYLQQRRHVNALSGTYANINDALSTFL